MCPAIILGWLVDATYGRGGEFVTLDIIVQIERRPGLRFVSEVPEIQGYSPEVNRYSIEPKDLGERNPFAA